MFLELLLWLHRVNMHVHAQGGADNRVAMFRGGLAEVRQSLPHTCSRSPQLPLMSPCMPFNAPPACHLHAHALRSVCAEVQAEALVSMHHPVQAEALVCMHHPVLAARDSLYGPNGRRGRAATDSACVRDCVQSRRNATLSSRLHLADHVPGHVMNTTIGATLGCPHVRMRVSLIVKSHSWLRSRPSVHLERARLHHP
jgi:hypothetical protein